VVVAAPLPGAGFTGSDPRRRIDILGDVTLFNRELEGLGLEPVFAEVEAKLEFEGVGLVPSSMGFCEGEGDDLTLRHRFFAPFVTKSPKSTGLFLPHQLAITGKSPPEHGDIPILLIMVTLVLLPIRIIHVHFLYTPRRLASWLSPSSSPAAWSSIYLIIRTTKQVLPSRYS
jgi:hypothetical protein